jgi:hypothetical protein
MVAIVKRIDAIFACRDARDQTDIPCSLLLVEKLFHRMAQRKCSCLCRT